MVSPKNKHKNVLQNFFHANNSNIQHVPPSAHTQPLPYIRTTTNISSNAKNPYSSRLGRIRIRIRRSDDGKKVGGKIPRSLRNSLSPYSLVMSLLVIINLIQRRNDIQQLVIPSTTNELDGDIAYLLALHYPPRPRAFKYYFDSTLDSSQSLPPPSRLPVHWERAPFEIYPSKRRVPYRSSKLDKDRHYPALEPYKNHPECTPMHPWQTKSRPTCNVLHETSLLASSSEARWLGSGFWRSSILLPDRTRGVIKSRKKMTPAPSPVVLKVLNSARSFDAATLDRHRVDAIVMDRLTSSPRVMDIYAYCGHSGLFEYADGGNLDDWIFRKGDSVRLPERDEDGMDLLYYAIDAAEALADLHAADSSVNGDSAIVHADITPSQFVWANGRYKLNDFNRAHLMYWNMTSGTETCPYHCQETNAWTFRSPEEYSYGLQTEKIDVYSLGNVFYVMLTEMYPFAELEETRGQSAAQKLIRKGRPPPLSKELKESDDVVDMALLEAMKMCHKLDWRERASAAEIRDFLLEKLRDIEHGWSESRD